MIESDTPEIDAPLVPSPAAYPAQLESRYWPPIVRPAPKDADWGLFKPLSLKTVSFAAEAHFPVHSSHLGVVGRHFPAAHCAHSQKSHI